MSLMFYPHEDDLNTSSLEEKLEVLMDGAERYKAAVLDMAAKSGDGGVKYTIPKEISFAFNWQEIAKLLTEIRQLPEATPTNKAVKADKLMKLAEIYELLRAAKMPKLEAVRIALTNEANQLKGSA